MNEGEGALQHLRGERVLGDKSHKACWEILNAYCSISIGRCVFAAVFLRSLRRLFNHLFFFFQVLK